MAGPRRPGPLHLATGSRPGVRARGDPGLDRPGRLRILRCVRRCAWDAGLAHVAGALASRGGRRLPRRWTVRPPSRSTGRRRARGRPGFTGRPVPRRCVGAGAAHRADRDRLRGDGDRAGPPERIRDGQAGAPGGSADPRSGGRPPPAGGLPARGGVRATRAGHRGRGRDGHGHRRAVGHPGQPRLERLILALERRTRRVSRAVRGRDVRLPRPAPAGRGAPVALGPADPRGAGVFAPGPGTRAGAAPPAPRHPVGRGNGGQRGPLRPRGAHARPAACDRRVLGGPGDRGDVGRAAPAGRAADRQRRRDHPDPQRALRGGQRAARAFGRHDRHPVTVRPKRARPGRLHRHRTARAADASRARLADRRGPVQGPGPEEQRGDHRERPALAQGAGVWRHAHRSGQGDVGRSVLRRPGPEADREPGRARRHVTRRSHPAAAARPRVPERVSRQPADRGPRARNGERRVAPLRRSEHPARRLRAAHQAAQPVPRERHAAGRAGDIPPQGGAGVARVRRHRRDGAVLRYSRSGRGARHQGEARRAPRASPGSAE